MRTIICGFDGVDDLVERRAVDADPAVLDVYQSLNGDAEPTCHNPL